MFPSRCSLAWSLLLHAVDTRGLSVQSETYRDKQNDEHPKFFRIVDAQSWPFSAGKLLFQPQYPFKVRSLLLHNFLVFFEDAEVPRDHFVRDL